MSYRPLSKYEADNMNRPQLIEDGAYQCVVAEYNHHDRNGNVLRDKNGDEVTSLKLKIWDKQGKERYIFTRIFWGENNKMSYRTRHFAESLGLVYIYESGKLYDEMDKCLGVSGWCDIYTQKERDKDDNSGTKWPAKNDVRDFISKNTLSVVEDKSIVDDDLPF